MGIDGGWMKKSITILWMGGIFETP
jgi:hypothetical protein